MLGTFSTYALILFSNAVCPIVRKLSKSCFWALFATLSMKMFINPQLDDVCSILGSNSFTFVITLMMFCS